MSLKILIGSNGGLTGVYLAKNLRELPDTVLYGADTDADGVGRFFVDKQFSLPPARDPDFLPRLVSLLEKEQVDVYLPTHSQEIKAVANGEAWLRKQTKAAFVVSPSATFAALDDKQQANLELQKAGISVPALIEGKPDRYPLFMKRRVGSGGKGAMLIENEPLYLACRQTYTDAVFFEFLHGREYTVDCLFDESGRLLGYNQRERCKMIGGAVSVTRNAWEFPIEPWLKRLAANWTFRGCVNFQYILQDDTPYFIDINLRYPSGGLPLTVASGLDIPKLTVRMLCGQPVPEQQMHGPDKMMFRYFEEIFAG